MRILMVIHTLWSRSLGGPRVQLELAEELRGMGHEVEKLSYDDVFPNSGEPRPAGSAGAWARRLNALAGSLQSNRSFADRAAAFVRRNAYRFDVIDANQTDLPFPKQALGFSGLLVARSVGLIPAFERFEQIAARRWPPPPLSLSHWPHRALTYPGRRRRRRDVGRSFRHADLINVSNSDDLVTVRDTMGYGAKVVMFPFGLSDARREAFRRRLGDARERLAARTVAFIGTWNSRKGSRDWPSIVQRVRELSPGARFLFLGTGLSREAVLRDFPEEARGALEIVPAYDSDELPGLLAGATVGAFPGYLEGFGFAVLEKLAAGLPTVLYDAPGTRDIVRPLERREVVPAGDTEAFAARVSALLALSPESYGELSAGSLRAAASFSWRAIAQATCDVYLERLGTLSPP
jgi:glycosyltransferase involved in cell wall biosynthesis